MIVESNRGSWRPSFMLACEVFIHEAYTFGNLIISNFLYGDNGAVDAILKYIIREKA